LRDIFLIMRLPEKPLLCCNADIGMVFHFDDMDHARALFQVGGGIVFRPTKISGALGGSIVHAAGVGGSVGAAFESAGHSRLSPDGMPSLSTSSRQDLSAHCAASAAITSSSAFLSMPDRSHGT
jgi:hypothetical protein